LDADSRLKSVIVAILGLIFEISPSVAKALGAIVHRLWLMFPEK
jgi:hypothetical protein